MKWSLLGEGARERSSPGGSFSGLGANLGQSLGQVPLPRIQSGTLALFAGSPDCFLLVTDAYGLCTTKHPSQGSALFQRSQPQKMRVSRQASLCGSGFIYLLGGIQKRCPTRIDGLHLSVFSSLSRLLPASGISTSLCIWIPNLELT